MSSYLFTNSPLNLVTRLSIESIPALESWAWTGLYLLVGITLFITMMITVKKDPDNI
ncbi:MAG: hypothetical protein R2741_03905 [Methanolobus sp.]